MAHKILIGGTAYDTKGGKCLVGGTVYSIKKGRTLVGGTGYDISFGIPLGSIAEGTIVYINENGAPAEFYVAKHDYESGLNGSGRTLLVRKDCYGAHKWNSSAVNAWASCILRSWLNGDYLNMLDDGIRGVIGTTKYYYTPGNGTTSVTTRSDAVFQLSVTELGITASYANKEGTALPIASTLQVAYWNGNQVSQWTRSPAKNGTTGVYSVEGVSAGITYAAGAAYFRTAFTLPSTIAVNPSNYQIG